MRLNPKDVAPVAAQMAESLLQANVLKKKGANGRSIVAISTFRNNTALYDFDPGFIFDRITVTLNKSGVAYSYVTGDSYVQGNRNAVAAHNRAVDSVNATERETAAFLGEAPRFQGGHKSSGPSPQYTLTLTLMEDHDTVGRTTQKQYLVKMTLNEVGSGLAIWEELSEDINKVGTRGAVGF